MAKKIEGLEQLLVEELQDLYDVEKQLVKALPKIAKSVTDSELENAFREHLEVTKGQVQRLEQVFQSMDMRPRSRPCKGMKGLLDEGREMMEEDMEEGLLDSALTGAGRKVEHYEMLGYESARALAQQLRLSEAAGLLQESMQEEIEADKMLAQISKRLLKEASARPEAPAKEPAGRATTTRKPATSGRKSSSAKSSAKRSTKGSSRPLTDRDEIQQWAEEREARPACVRGTGGQGDTGMIRLDFPGYSGEESLQEISWDDWFSQFDDRKLALLVQDSTAGGQKSNFNKLVSREATGRPKARSAR